MTLVPDEHRFTGVSMRRRLARLLGAVAAMLVIALAVAVLALIQSRGLDARADGPYYRALVDGERAALALSDADASLRAYRATCDDAALEPWTRAVGSSGRITLLSDVERRELAGDAEVILAHEEAARRTTAWFEQYAEPVLRAVQAAPAGQAACNAALADTAPPAAQGRRCTRARAPPSSATSPSWARSATRSSPRGPCGRTCCSAPWRPSCSSWCSWAR
nr:hypothetical protein GCM10025730_12220 [Promicromonospora thailandica]